MCVQIKPNINNKEKREEKNRFFGGFRYYFIRKLCFAYSFRYDQHVAGAVRIFLGPKTGRSPVRGHQKLGDESEHERLD